MLATFIAPRLCIAAIGLALVLAMSACGDSNIVGPGDHLLRTPDAAYTLSSDPRGNLRAMVPYAYTNTTKRVIYLPNCQGYVAPSLQKLTGDKWLDVWTDVAELGCLGAPVVIQPGATYADTLLVRGYTYANQPTGAAFLTPGATYRLNMRRAVHNYRTEGTSLGDPLPEAHRVSGPFSLVQAP